MKRSLRRKKTIILLRLSSILIFLLNQAIEERIDAKIDNAAAAEYNLETGAIAARESANIIHENELFDIGFMPVIDEEEEEEAEQGIIARDERTPIIPVESTSFTSIIKTVNSNNPAATA